MPRLLLLPALTCIGITLVGCGPDPSTDEPAPPVRYNGPIIDMHMHATDVALGDDGKPLRFRVGGYPGPGERFEPAATTERQIFDLTLDAMDRHHIVLGYLSGYQRGGPHLVPSLDRVQTWLEEAPERFWPSVMVAGPDSPPVDLIRSEVAAGRLRGIGEVATQYMGLAPNDPQLAAYFDLAAELDLPVHLHAAGIGAPDPLFQPANGNPLLLGDILSRHPNLRIYLENAGFPFTEDFLAMAMQYPQLYGDISTITWVANRHAFDYHVGRLVQSGLGQRLMFGTDQMQWPESMDLAVEAIQSADYLTLEQKADIFYNNAARFLRLSDQVVARHHEQ